MFRTVCGGGKGGGSSYDPQIGVAAGQSAAVAARAEDFAETYYKDVVTPMLGQQNTLLNRQMDSQDALTKKQMEMADRSMSLSERQQTLSDDNAKASRDSQDKLNKLYDLNADQMTQARDRYNKFGVPAEDAYYKMVNDYSAPGEEERQARLAKGDVGLAAANQRGAFMRSLSGLGISASSPAAVSALSDQAVANAAMEAGAATRARGAAKQLGMTLTSDAANYGRGGTSSVLAYGNAAQGNTTGAFGVANGALNGGNGALGASAGMFGSLTGATDSLSGSIRGLGSNIATAGNSAMSGFSTAGNIYGNNLDAYSKLGSSDIQAKAANDPMAGLGKLAGTLGSAWIMSSDRRLKEHLFPYGALPSGIPIYIFNYIGDAIRRIGVMAQDVLPKIPSAVRVRDDGMYMVHYGELR